MCIANFKISIIVPMYNAEKYIQECIESIINQSYHNLEIILVDNNSTDRTYQIADKLLRKDDRIKLFSCKKQGPSAARNLGMDKATGEFITFVDADDFLKIDTYKLVINEIENNDPDIVLFGYFIANDLGVKTQNSVNYIKDGFLYKESYRNFLESIIFSAKGKNVPSYSVLRVIKRSIINKYHLRFDENIRRSEDFQFLVKVHLYSKSMSSIYSKKLYAYRQINSSITHSYTDGYWEMIERIFDDLFSLEMLRNNKKLRDKLNMRFLIYALKALENICNSKKGDSKYQKIKNILNDKDIKKIKKQINIFYGIRNIGLSFMLLKFKSPFLVLLYEKIRGYNND